MKSIVIAEKPSVARDIARVLGCNQKGNGFLEGKQYIVTWALGHLVTHAQPEQYDNDFKEWKMDTLPIIPKPFKLVPIKQSMKQFNAVKSQLQRGDVVHHQRLRIAVRVSRGDVIQRLLPERAEAGPLPHRLPQRIEGAQMPQQR